MRSRLNCAHPNWASPKSVQGNPSGQDKPPVDIGLECSVNLPGQYVASVVAYQLLGRSELSQQKVCPDLMDITVGQVQV